MEMVATQCCHGHPYCGAGSGHESSCPAGGKSWEWMHREGEFRMQAYWCINFQDLSSFSDSRAWSIRLCTHGPTFSFYTTMYWNWCPWHVTSYHSMGSWTMDRHEWLWTCVPFIPSPPAMAPWNKTHCMCGSLKLLQRHGSRWSCLPHVHQPGTSPYRQHGLEANLTEGHVEWAPSRPRFAWSSKARNHRGNLRFWNIWLIETMFLRRTSHRKPNPRI